ncbi:MAG: pirin family protein [Ilumatobacteraceae bacterium]|jgi:hypothetical protein|nr:pirin family protein [Ilumatobacteraceae bacterium]
MTVELVIAPRRRPVGGGEVLRLLPFHARRMVGPFIFADRSGWQDDERPEPVNVDAHPHIGLSTVTYLFAGALEHRDSTGAVQTIRPGDINWMTAGSGVAHTERSTEGAAEVVRGLQTWVALPVEREGSDPSFQHTPGAAMPVIDTGDGTTATVLAGTGYGAASPVEVSSPLVLADLRLAAGSSDLVDATHPERALLVVEGEVEVDGIAVGQHSMAVLAAGPCRMSSSAGARLMLLGGEPVGPRTIWWNFVASDPAAIDDARERWNRQDFPLVPDDHDPWVRAPER